MYGIYLPTFTITINQLYANIPVPWILWVCKIKYIHHSTDRKPDSQNPILWWLRKLRLHAKRSLPTKTWSVASPLTGDKKQHWHPRKNVAYLKQKIMEHQQHEVPKQSMYGIFTYIYHRHKPNVGEYTLHGSYGVVLNLGRNGLFCFNMFFSHVAIQHCTTILGSSWAFLVCGTESWSVKMKWFRSVQDGNPTIVMQGVISPINAP